MTDGPIRLNEVTRAAVDSGRLIHLATLNPDGTPQVTCVYARLGRGRDRRRSSR